MFIINHKELLLRVSILYKNLSYINLKDHNGSCTFVKEIDTFYVIAYSMPLRNLNIMQIKSVQDVIIEARKSLKLLYFEGMKRILP